MKLFVSYRRSDTAVFARLIRDELQRRVGDDGTVFMDTRAIRAGEDWADKIETALEEAETVVVLVGPTWLTVQDEQSGRRRIDLEDDWVHMEVKHALEQRKRIVPVLVNGAKPLQAIDLPGPLQDLARAQALRVDTNRLDGDLEALGSAVVADGGAAPKPRPTEHDLHAGIRLTDDELDEALDGLGGDWQRQHRADPLGADGERVELVREYEFASFGEVLAFMQSCVEFINKADHHPRWENTFRSLKVWLSTWDIGHRPTRLDLELARFMEQQFASSSPAESERPPMQCGPFEVGQDQVRGLAWAPGGRYVAACSADGAVVVIDESDGREVLRRDLGRESKLGAVRWNGDAEFAVAGKQIVSAIDWESASKRDVHGPGRFRDVAWSPDGKAVAAVAHSTLRIWPNPPDTQFFEVDLRQEVNTVEWAGRDFLYVGGKKGVSRVTFDAKAATPLAATEHCLAPSEVLSLSVHDDALLAGTVNGEVARVVDGQWSTVGEHPHRVVGVRPLSDGRILSRDRKGTLCAWTVGVAEPSWHRPADMLTRGSVCGLACHPTQPLIAVPHTDTRAIVIVSVTG